MGKAADYRWKERRRSYRYWTLDCLKDTMANKIAAMRVLLRKRLLISVCVAGNRQETDAPYGQAATRYRGCLARRNQGAAGATTGSTSSGTSGSQTGGQGEEGDGGKQEESGEGEERGGSSEGPDGSDPEQTGSEGSAEQGNRQESVKGWARWTEAQGLLQHACTD